MRLLPCVALVCAVSPVLCSKLQSRQNETLDPLAEIDSFEPSDDIAQLAADGLAQLQALTNPSLTARSTQCTLNNVVIRKDW